MNLIKEIKRVIGIPLNYYKNNNNFKSLTTNIIWLLFDSFFRLGTTAILFIFLARYLGPKDFGIFNYSLAYISLFGIIASLGLDSIVVRELVNQPEKKSIILGSSFLIKLIFGIIAMFLSISFIFILNSGDQDYNTRVLIVILSIGLIFRPFEVIDYFFLSEVSSKYSIIGKNISTIISNGLKLYIVFTSKSLIALGLITTIEFALIGISLIIAFKFQSERITKWKYDGIIAKKLIKDSWPLVLASFGGILYSRTDQVIIGKMMNDYSVGIYSAAVRISEIWYFVPTIIIQAMLPAIVQTKKYDERTYTNRMSLIYELMIILSIVACLIITLSSDSIILFLFGKEFIQASPILTINVWCGIFVALGVSSSAYLVAENFPIISFLRTIVAGIVNVILNIIFIPFWGVKGSAIASLIAFSLTIIILIFPKQTREHGILIINSFQFRQIIFYIRH
ncbi:MAG: flippase [Candidatus Kapabacteria bacterium]|nr:flippase [Candidatus Kapabacteria bacterium]